VDPGLYTAQVSVGTSTEQQVIIVKDDSPVHEVLAIEVEAVTPVRSTTTNHEYHSYPAQQHSLDPQVQLGEGSRLVLFVRVPSADHSQAQQTIGSPAIDLLNRDFERVDIPAWDLGPGYSAISLDLDPDVYILRSQGTRGSVDQTVVTSEYWTTLAFVPVWPVPDVDPIGWEPSFDAMTMHMTRLGQGFDPYGEGSDAILAAEVALKGLRSGSFHLSRQAVDLLLDEKFSNPMLGIYGAHALLQEWNIRWGIAELVIRNLRKLTPGHPDVDALHVLLKDERGTKSMSRVQSFELPPMLYASYEAVIARNAHERQLIAEGSIAERAASQLRLDGAWARWDTLEDEPAAVTPVDPTLVDAAAQAVSQLIVTDELGVDQFTEPISLSSVSVDLGRYLTEMASEESRGEERDKIDVSELSRQVGLPVSKVRKSLRAISDASTTRPY